MKKLLSLAFLSIVIASFISCSKDDDNSPAYVGTWTAATSFSFAKSLKTTVITDLGFRKKLELGGSDFTVTMEGGGADQWMAYEGTKGSLSVAGDTLTMTIKQEGILNDAGDLSYTAVATKDQKAMKSKWIVSGNKLTLISDENGDGDFNDVATGYDSNTVYTKL